MRQTFSVTFKTLVVALGLSLVNPAFAAEPAKAAPAGPEKADVAKGDYGGFRRNDDRAGYDQRLCVFGKTNAWFGHG